MPAPWSSGISVEFFYLRNEGTGHFVHELLLERREGVDSLHLACSRCAVAAGGSLGHKGQVLPLEVGWQAQRWKRQSGCRLDAHSFCQCASGLQPEETTPLVQSPGAFSQGSDRPLQGL